MDQNTEIPVALPEVSAEQYVEQILEEFRLLGRTEPEIATIHAFCRMAVNGSTITPARADEIFALAKKACPPSSKSIPE